MTEAKLYVAFVPYKFLRMCFLIVSVSLHLHLGFHTFLALHHFNNIWSWLCHTWNKKPV